jgi:preprotein translocase SecE subunit
VLLDSLLSKQTFLMGETMAAKKNETSAVTRVRASSSKSAKKTSKTAATKTSKQTEGTKKTLKKASGIFAPFVAMGQYFKGSWVELRQVRWPTRQATWSLTAAVLLFTAFFVVLILLLDAGFKYLFELILG